MTTRRLFSSTIGSIIATALAFPPLVFPTEVEQKMLDDAVDREDRPAKRRVFYIDVGPMSAEAAHAKIEQIKHDITQRRTTG